ncbi:MAG: M28 family metallopeptidase [Chloroflexi bacterium]|nr:M28 family metallopeptidase [Chloroflexota bacterium]MCI0581263.1 M28 family metallopeptidase [Chloroflexota bacterium]MCI0644251.1 M28 family metallopeptidase [Chloroflexota bacterium]MCI0727570.1 M28 family metallopeptidase [Chloroflexota bacterium]
MFPETLRAARLMDHVRCLAREIGPRPSTSPQERQAADYVKRTLRSLDVANIWEQRFQSQNSLGWATIPYLLAGALAAPLAWAGGRAGRLLGGLLLLAGAFGLHRFSLGRPPFFQRLIATGPSQNVIARFPPAGEAQRHLYLIGHLDTNKQRFLAPLPWPGLVRPLNTASLVLAALGGLTLLLDALLNHRRRATWQWLPGAIPLSFLPALFFDEAQPHVDGANDNASAVAVLLTVAEALQRQPLQNTEVTLLFTGCEEVICVGIEEYLQKYAPPRENSYWIDLEMVGTGNLCFVTRHGINHFSHYTPDPEMVALAARAAGKHPQLNVIGKEMLILEEVANLRHHGYKAICLAGFGDDGYLANWHRLSDNLDNIEPETLERAARYTWALMQEVDRIANKNE